MKLTPTKLTPTKLKRIIKEAVSDDIKDRYNAAAEDFLHHPVPEDFEVFTKFVSGVSGKHDSLCYSNALELYNENDMPLFVGVAISKKVVKRLMSDDPKYINSSHHAWNMKNGKIYDSTLGSQRGMVYIGKQVPNRIADRLKDGSDVRQVLFKYLGI